MTRRIAIMIVALLCIPVGLASAQDGPTEGPPCPSGFSCAAFEGATLAFNPEQGFVQYVVVEERSTSVINFRGEESSDQIVIVAFTQNDGGTFVAGDLYTQDRDGIFANAELGDVFVLTGVS